MSISMLVAAFAGAGVTSAIAAEPIVGEWLVQDQTARVAVDICDGSAWGIISWEKSPGTDASNPDPAKRGQPTLGIPIIIGMKPTPKSTWDGKIYNAENGKTYDAHLSMKAPDVLRVEGCVLGFLCGGQDWTRYKASNESAAKTKAPAYTSGLAPAAPSAKPAAPKPVPGKPTTFAIAAATPGASPSSPVCAAIAKLNATKSR